MDILIVDDSATTRRLIVRSLVQAGLCEEQMSQAADGALAFEVLSAQTEPVLVLCDVNMPNMSGEELLARAASLPRKHTFVMITSVATDKRRATLLDLGAVKVLGKPFDPAQLADILAPYLPCESGLAPSHVEEQTAQPPMPDTAATATLGLVALRSVLEQMAFTEAMPLNGDPPTATLYGGTVRLEADEKCWVVRVAADWDASAELSRRLTGQEPDAGESLRLDAMRELANMMAGELITRCERFRDATPALPMSGVLPPGGVRPRTLRGVRLVPGGHHLWLDVQEVG
jgi:two-component system chemotaxis response regulator CheY